MCIYCGTEKYRQIYENHFGNIPTDHMGRSYHIHHIDGNHKNNLPNNLKCVSIEEHYKIHLKQGDLAAALRLGSRLHICGEEKSRLAKESSLARVANGTHNFLSGEISKIANQKRILDGTHNLLGDKNPSHARIANGTHNLLGDKNPSHARIANGTHNWQDGSATKERNLRMSAQGTHPFQSEEFRRSHNKKRVESGTHPFLGGEVSKKTNQQRILNGTHNFIGENNPSHKRLQNSTHNALEEHQCPHCGQVGKGFVMFRHHYERCKWKVE